MKILFYTKSDCEACRIMDNILTNAINECSSNIVVSKIYKNKLEVSENKIKFPTIIIVDEHKKELARLEGTYPKDYIINIINKLKTI